MNELASRVFGSWIRRVDAASVRADLVAGILGALLVLPQGIAFATLAGLPPEYGLTTAVVPCVVAALFGSSWHVVSGPTNANSLALFATLAPLALVGSSHYIALALTVTVLVGIMQFVIGVLRLGTIANFISPAALRGFMAGAAALIALYALPDLLGLPSPSAHRLTTLAEHLASRIADVFPAAFPVGLLTIVAALLARSWRPRWPWMLIGLLFATALAYAIDRLAGTQRIAVVGPIPAIWPRFHVPPLDLALLPDLVGIAFALTIVALGQSVSIAKAVATRSGQHIDTNREFRGQGLSNIVGGLFSSYVSCGSLNRSFPNLEAGARTPLAAVFASAWLLLLAAASASLLALIPMTAISALLLLVSWSLFDLAGWRQLWRFSRQDFGVAAATFAATLTIRLEVAILLGTILSLVTYVYRTSKPAIRVMGFDGTGPARPLVVRSDVVAPLPECPQVKMIRMEGEVYFGAVSHVGDQLRDLRAPAHSPKHLLVMSKSMNFIDLAAAEMWRTELLARRAAGGDLYFHRPRAPVLELWQRIGFMAELGTDHIFPAKRIAIATIFDRLDRDICAHCTIRVFEECQALPLPIDGAASEASPGSLAKARPSDGGGRTVLPGLRVTAAAARRLIGSARPGNDTVDRKVDRRWRLCRRDCAFPIGRWSLLPARGGDPMNAGHRGLRARTAIWPLLACSLPGMANAADDDRRRPDRPQLHSARDDSGVLVTISTNGFIDQRNPFFRDLGGNGRSCVTCHQPQEGWTITPKGLRERFEQTQRHRPGVSPRRRRQLAAGRRLDAAGARKRLQHAAQQGPDPDRHRHSGERRVRAREGRRPVRLRERRRALAVPPSAGLDQPALPQHGDVGRPRDASRRRLDRSACSARRPASRRCTSTSPIRRTPRP